MLTSDVAITEAALVAAAKNLLRAPVRGAPPEVRFVDRGTELLVVADDRSRRIADALRGVAEAIGASPTVVMLERPDDKPLKVLPPAVRSLLARVPATIFAARAPNGERSMREQLAAVVKASGARYARLQDVEEAAFVRAFSADPARVRDVGRRLAERIARGRLVEVTSPGGTALHVTVAPGAWVERLGEIVPGTGVGFPAGALFTSPEGIDGTFVADASLGEFFGLREGLLAGKPVRFEIAQGRVASVHAPHDPRLEADIRATLAFADNSNRIGLVAIGVNVGIDAATGDASVDQNLQGFHLGVGDPGGKSTNVGWKARTSFFACQAASRVVVDGDVVIDGGKITDRS